MEYAIAIVVVLVVIFAVYLDRKEKKGSSTSAPRPKPTPVPVADKNDNGITSKAELKTLTKVQLLDLADKNSLKVKKSGTKAQVINEIHS
ncbi:uncharacterized protein METZ01_LOCUS247890, partial [marine metagenome]